MAVQTVQCRSAYVVGWRAIGTPFVVVALFFVVLGLLGDEGSLFAGSALLAVISPLWLAAVLSRRMTITWDDAEMTCRRGRRCVTFRWAELAELTARSNGRGWPDYRLTSRDGQRVVIAQKGLSEPKGPFAERLRRQHDRHLRECLHQGKRQPLVVVQWELLALAGLGMCVLVGLMFAAVAGLGVGAVRSTNPAALVCGAVATLLLGCVCVALAVSGWRRLPWPLMATTDGLRHGPHHRCLTPWSHFREATLARIRTKGVDCDSLVLVGADCRLAAYATGFGFLELVALARQRCHAPMSMQFTPRPSEPWDDMLEDALRA